MASWDALVDAALATLSARKLLFNTRLITLAPPPALTETFAGPESWDRATVEIQVDRNSLQQWLTTNGEVSIQEEEVSRKLILFSGDDYMCLSSHPAVREAAVKAGSSSVWDGAQRLFLDLWLYYLPQTSTWRNHWRNCRKRRIAFSVPLDFRQTRTALMTALGSISSLLACAGRKPAPDERIAIFSDALNHASTIDGISSSLCVQPL
ncbi:unnamed protein product [Miscanthus lutarioriparius]|uniref:8-amino-7-oxononanoate synthase n=1 Tax=Miscanthus lutarioriparius TaxID=422564 RepID=A0A811MC33_9POAL|nr:unnamed protein product [Miscanthus lutarioriparius]